MCICAVGKRAWSSSCFIYAPAQLAAERGSTVITRKLRNASEFSAQSFAALPARLNDSIPLIHCASNCLR